MADILVEVCDKRFPAEGGGERHVIAGVRFRARAGERIAITGPSGCGKTTLLRIVAGLDRDFTGRIERPPDARIGFVFQEPRLLPWRRVDDNLRLVLHGPRETVDARIRQALAEVGLSGEERTFAAHLSLGMARRVAIARALAIEPDILLLDEPFVSLDEPTARRLRLLLLELLEAHRPTTLFVTHNLREALMIAERLLVLSPAPARVLAEIDVPLSASERRRPEAVEALWRGLHARPECEPLLGVSAP